MKDTLKLPIGLIKQITSFSFDENPAIKYNWEKCYQNVKRLDPEEIKLE